MNKYELLFQEILDRTASRELAWRQLPRTANADMIFHLGSVFRQFAAVLPREGEDFTVVLVEKKVEEAQLFHSYERYVPELLVLDQRGELVTTLTDSVIELKDMLRLAQLVEAQGDKAVKLFHVPSATAC